jgi:chromosome segregation ATPase
MMQTLGKMFSLNMDQSNSNQMNLQINTDFLEKTKKLNDLKERVENFELDNKNLVKTLNEKEIDYIEKIKSLEKQLLSSDKSDIIVLQKQNKDYETQIANLNKAIQNLTGKHRDESVKFKSMIGELMMLKDQLEQELKAMESLKREISEKQAKKIPYQFNNKVEMVMKYNSVEKKEGFSRYQVRKSTRAEFDK